MGYIVNKFCFVSIIQTFSPLLISNTDFIDFYNASSSGWSSVTKLAAATSSMTATSVEWRSSFNSAVALFGGGGGHVLFYELCSVPLSSIVLFDCREFD